MMIILKEKPDREPDRDGYIYYGLYNAVEDTYLDFNHEDNVYGWSNPTSYCVPERHIKSLLTKDQKLLQVLNRDSWCGYYIVPCQVWSDEDSIYIEFDHINAEQIHQHMDDTFGISNKFDAAETKLKNELHNLGFKGY